MALTEKEEEPPEEMPFFFGGAAKRVPPGMYRVVLTVDGVEVAQGLRVEADPARPATTTAEGDESPQSGGLRFQGSGRRRQ
jgi:hypothetical protein